MSNTEGVKPNILSPEARKWAKSFLESWVQGTARAEKSECDCCSADPSLGENNNFSAKSAEEIAEAKRLFDRFQTKDKTYADPLPTVNFNVLAAKEKDAEAAVPVFTMKDMLETLVRQFGTEDESYSLTQEDLAEGDHFFIIPAYINSEGLPEAIVPAANICQSSQWAAALNRLQVKKLKEALKNALTK